MVYGNGTSANIPHKVYTITWGILSYRCSGMSAMFEIAEAIPKMLEPDKVFQNIATT